MVNQRSLLTTMVLLLAMLCSYQVSADPIASIDRSVIAIDDTLTLTIRINESGSFKGPDLGPLTNNFQVLSNNQNSRHTIRNGKSESFTEWVITLAPLRQGQLTIPAIDIDGQTTQSITINVQPSVPVSAGSLQPVFLESEVDKKSVYVQQQLIYTLRIFQSIQLDNMNISEPEFDNAAMEKLGQNSFQRRIQNIPYRVHELRYAIFPQQSGELIIPELVFTASEALSRQSVFALQGQGKRLRKMTEQHQVTVMAAPPGFSGQTWLPAESLKLEQNWSSNPDEVRVGDSITRTITLKATGLMDSQLPPVEFPHLEGAKLYPDQGNAETTVSELGVNSSRKDSVAIIPTQPGELVLPAITLNWWDTQQQKMQQTVIAATRINVKPALASSASASTPLAIDHSQSPLATTTAATSLDSSQRWQILSALLAAGWLLTLIMWWRLKQASQPEATHQAKVTVTTLSEKQAFKQLQKACRSGNASSLRQPLIEWARAYWPNENIQSLQDIQRHCDSAPLTSTLMHLENTLYGNSPDSSGFNGESLLAAIKTLRQQHSESGGSQPQQLPPLYSN